jgi:alpha-ketoglutarate-dependent taurine dioxygenase
MPPGRATLFPGAAQRQAVTMTPQPDIHTAAARFDLDNDDAYRAWREQKLEDYPTRVEALSVEIDDPRRLSAAEHDALLSLCRKSNMAVYIGRTGCDPDKMIPASLGTRFGLHTLDRNMGADDDGITALQLADDPGHERYIPYTNRAIHWHTDGYYNAASQQILALILHCVTPARTGGENALMDHEIAYIHLRDGNPDHIRALMNAEAMTIPANIENGREIRPARSGPVFSVLPDGNLHMRYTARARNVQWRDDDATRDAVRTLERLLDSDDPRIFRLTLQPGQGVICNNVLHTRGEFHDEGGFRRLLYRLRYYERTSRT